jgi:hypothetical protein
MLGAAVKAAPPWFAATGARGTGGAALESASGVAVSKLGRAGEGGGLAEDGCVPAATPSDSE